MNFILRAKNLDSKDSHINPLRRILCKIENFRRRGKQNVDYYTPIDSSRHAEQRFEGEGMSKTYHIRVPARWKSSVFTSLLGSLLFFASDTFLKLQRMPCKTNSKTSDNSASNGVLFDWKVEKLCIAKCDWKLRKTEKFAVKLTVQLGQVYFRPWNFLCSVVV